MGTPIVDFSEQNLIRAGFKPEQAKLLRLMDQKVEQKVQNVLTRDSFDQALEKAFDRHTAQMKEFVRYEVKSARDEAAKEFATVRQEIVERHIKQLTWMTGVIFTAIGATLAAIRLLFF
ncbi:MAG: hypothetical protein FWF41_07485 [Betaproteobacteria bacterium]|nr:hypothetical protein [Betaproteobacteria bacterium]